MKKGDEGKRNFDNKWRYLSALGIAIFLFIFGFLASYSVLVFDFQRTSNLQEDIFYDFYRTELSYDLFGKVKCNNPEIEGLSEPLDFQGAMIAEFESRFGKDDSKVFYQKRFYNLLQASHYNFMLKANEDCSYDRDIILFFYSNDALNKDYSERVGDYLTILKRKDPSILIYSFDSSFEDPVVLDLRSRYGINNPVSVLINGEDLVTSIDSLDDLESPLK